MATTLAPVLNELVAPCRRTPFPSESYWKCSRSGRTTVQPIGSEHPSSSRGASPALDTHRRGRRIQHSARICLGIPIASRPDDRHEATTRTRAPEPKSLSHQTGRRSCSSETCAHGKFANDPMRTAVSSGGRNFVPIATRSASRGGAEGVRPRMHALPPLASWLLVLSSTLGLGRALAHSQAPARRSPPDAKPCPDRQQLDFRWLGDHPGVLPPRKRPASTRSRWMRLRWTQVHSACGSRRLRNQSTNGGCPEPAPSDPGYSPG